MSQFREISRRIWITFAIPGFHAYPYAPDDVSYLRSTHRHLFKFKVSISVAHNEREIEYHQFLSWIASHYSDGGTLQASNKSCETLAEELANVICRRYPGRTVEVEVSEDGECGSVITVKDVPSNAV